MNSTKLAKSKRKQRRAREHQLLPSDADPLDFRISRIYDAHKQREKAVNPRQSISARKFPTC
jgi:hypothetical protein